MNSAIGSRGQLHRRIKFDDKAFDTVRFALGYKNNVLLRYRNRSYVIRTKTYCEQLQSFSVSQKGGSTAYSITGKSGVVVAESVK